jgi:hypothetical protein
MEIVEIFYLREWFTFKEISPNFHLDIQEEFEIEG